MKGMDLPLRLALITLVVMICVVTWIDRDGGYERMKYGPRTETVCTCEVCECGDCAGR